VKGVEGHVVVCGDPPYLGGYGEYIFDVEGVFGSWNMVYEVWGGDECDYCWGVIKGVFFYGKNGGGIHEGCF